MPKLIARIDETLKVESYSFMIMDEDGSRNLPDDAPSMDDLIQRLHSPGVWFVAAANLAFVESADDWHVVEVALEKWDEEPPADAENWALTCTAELFASSGRLALVQTLGNRAPKVLDLGETAQVWAVRASRRPGPGRRKVGQKPPTGIEAYRFQFWSQRR
ncbi:hypothetical protein [Nonomuraea candida]|uniref:hypothetical protein n=1 Tax=Nonomuraea candida TaxID=359159 RepID=UPI0005BB99C2|nr:hypothetical protein [Nonomuraea candida]